MYSLKRKLGRGRKKLHSGSLQGLHPTQYVILAIKSSRMRWVRQMACRGGERKCIQGFDGET